MRRGWGVLLVAALVVLATAASAGVVLINSSQWWRNCATVDMDFANNRYYWKNSTACTGTGGTEYSSLSSFITAIGATFTRAGTTSVTASGDPLYLDAASQSWVSRAAATANNIATPSGSFYADAGQSFVSRASVTNNVTWTLPSAFLDAGQSWVSHATDVTGLTPGAPFSSAGGAVFASRASVGTYISATGSFQTAAANTVRPSTTWNGSAWVSNGNLFEPAATNLIRNNGTTGATAGVSGALPTNWTLNLPAGLTYSVSSIGTEDGVPSFTITVTGTNSTGSTGFGSLIFDTLRPVSASTTYALSGYARVTAGTMPAPASFYLYWYNSSSTFVSNSAIAALNTSATTLPRSFTGGTALSPATAAYASPGLAFNIAAGASVNFTLYVGSPQLEQGSAATSTIVTSSLAATRAADLYDQQTANYFDSVGTLSYLGAGSARSNAYYYNGTSWVLGGTQVEPASTNYIRNSRVGGAVPGSPGIMPANFNLAGIPTGVTYSVTGTGTTQGMNYFDVTVSGTNNAGVQACPVLWFEAPGVIAGSVGQTWSHSVFLANVGGTAIGMGPQWYNYNSSMTVLGGGSGPGFTPTSTLKRYSFTATVTDAGTASVRPMVFWCQSAGASVNFTLRVANPQFEQSPAATAPIPTAGTALTRNADVVNWQPASYFDSAGVLHYGAADTVRTNYDFNGSSWILGGSLLEPSKTNLLINSLYSGGVGGKFGTSGVTPTGWYVGNSANFSDVPLTSYGFVNGMPTLDVSVNGTFSAAGWIQVSPSQSPRAAVQMGDVVTFSFYNQTLSGSPTSAQYVITAYDSGGTSLGVVASNYIGSTSTLTRRSLVGTVTYPTAATIGITASYYYGSGATATFSTRIAGAQLEKGSITSFIPTAGVTVTRPADIANWQPATYEDSTGRLRYAGSGVSRTDYAYNGSSWVSQGVLAEPARTNLNTVSMVPVADGGSNGYSSSNVLAPDGRSYMNKCYEDSSGGTCRWNYAMAANTSYTLSMFVKAAERNSFTFLAYGDASNIGSISVNLATGSIVSTYGTATSNAGIQNVGNGIYRVWFTFTPSAVVAASYYDIRLSDSATPGPIGTTYTRTAGSGLYIWGVQLEQGNSVSSFIPTNGATATRPADVYTAPSGGTYFDSTGTMRVAAPNTPRLDYDPVTLQAKGILIEESRINYVANSMMVGATSPSTAPTGWGITGSGANGISTQVVGVYTVNGVTAVRLRFTGTANSASATAIYYSNGAGPTGISANTKVTQSIYARVVAGAFPGTISARHWGPISDSTNATISDYQPAIVIDNTWVRRISVTPGVSTGTAPYKVPRSAVILYWGNGAVVDVTLDFGAPQVEVADFPTSFIPTYGSAVSRASDDFKIPGSAGWIGTSTHTMGATGVIPYSKAGAFPAYAFLDDGVSGGGYIVMVYTGTGLYNYGEVKEAGAQAFLGGKAYTLGNGTSTVIAVGGGTARFAMDGTSPSAVTKTVPSVSFLSLGGTSYNGGSLNGWLSRVWYMPTREPDTSLGDYSR